MRTYQYTYFSNINDLLMKLDIGVFNNLDKDVCLL